MGTGPPSYIPLLPLAPSVSCAFLCIFSTYLVVAGLADVGTSPSHVGPPALFL